MRRSTRQALLALPVILVLGALLAWAGSQGSVRVGDWPVFGLCVAIAFGSNAIAFLPAYAYQTEKYYDLTGSLTYLAVLTTAIAARSTAGELDERTLVLAALVAIWAIRLGHFLFRRIREDGRDPRFDAIKPDAARFLMAFLLQGLWVSLTAGAALAAMTSSSPVPLGPFDAVAGFVWLGGFGLEVVADRQKRNFRKDPAQRDRFIATGLWARSRHPNYLGEIVLWVGIALLAWPALSGWQWATLVSPLFVFVLLTRVSGIPLLEARGRARWGDDPAYRAYLERTPSLWLRVGPVGGIPSSPTD